jgi:hypothetical protein
MSKILLPQDKESLIGICLFIGVSILFLFNGFIFIKSLIDVYGAKPSSVINKTVEANVIEQAINIISKTEKKN